MKLSNRILTIFVVVLALLTAGIVVWARTIAPPLSRLDASGPDVERQLEVGQFSAVQLRGAWEVELTRAPEYRAVLVGPRGVVEAAEVSTAGGRLVILLSGAVDIGRAPRVIITAPTVAELSLAGAIDGRVVGLDAARLKVAATGAAELTFEQSTIGDLVLETSGAVDLDLADSLVENAALDLSGATELSITMNGGSLTGRVRGAGEIRYAGEVHSVDLDTSPAVDVRRR